MSRGDLLLEAYYILNNNYKTSKGASEFSFDLIAEYWETYLKSRGFNVKLKNTDAQMMLALFKIAREALQEQRDNIRDANNYLDLYADTKYSEDIDEEKIEKTKQTIANTVKDKEYPIRYSEQSSIEEKYQRLLGINTPQKNSKNYSYESWLDDDNK